MTPLQIIQLVVSGALMVVILLQNKSAGLTGTFGGSGEMFSTKRGPEKFLFIATIILGIVFVTISLLFIII